MKKYESIRLVKSEDLNHHGTLFAARGAAWLVEAAFTAAACAQGNTSQVVCRNLHDMAFTHPVKPGDILNFTGRIVYTGKTSLIVHVKAVSVMTGEQAIEGFATFVTVQEGIGGKLIHGIVLDKAEDEEELSLRERALKYVKK